MRGFLFVIVLLLIPAVLYFSYASYVRTKLDEFGRPRQPIKLPWSWLAIAGGILVVIAFLGYSLLELGSGDGTYHPARIKDGQVEEGYFEKQSN
jgi:drug/metabolite transporter (DMT)-like permease